ncbi:hypothetical protein Cob_v010286 [Colletotrichum orbiculare MAFF 240422]|uniref:Uncharacterized protein n=1 Tax=Colletotrichum orbiculare (strain 104-T / ATCC 96160 / CBS 514.97 / LARS 414 / MAFF 240422) TaxID=1213857 RepID=N4VQE3_COLOR|nr:hypothetical protein Cob_v010286 [Colletotrichum orbiculare MAFF 240422]
MRLIFLFFATANAVRMACNGGTAGNNGCEGQRLHTYCCTDEFTPGFPTAREVTVLTEDNNHNVYCAGDAPNGPTGKRYCAP